MTYAALYPKNIMDHSWKIHSTITAVDAKKRPEEIILKILKGRNIPIRSKKVFFEPPRPATIELTNIGVDKNQLRKAVSLVKKHAKNSSSPIIIYGDYDADGITATAILWETLHKSGIKAMPFIPRREQHGYGLSIAGIDEVIKTHHPGLIIAVDNGVTAIKETDYAKGKSVDIIIVDHHQLTKHKHPANALIHSTLVAGAGLTWLFSNYLVKSLKLKTDPELTLELAAIGTISDLVPLVGPSRSIAKYGIEAIRKSKRVGLKALIDAAGLVQAQLDTYQIGFNLAPRINSMGRLENAIESLRMLCTKDKTKAETLAKLLNTTNQTRQHMTDELTKMAMEMARTSPHDYSLVLSHTEFHEGIIGLVAGKLSQSFWRPSIVISQGKELSKGSARSIPGFNIIEAIRKSEHLLVGAGGHPMAAGFTIRTEKIAEFQQTFFKLSKELIAPQLLERTIFIDLEVEFSDLTYELINLLTNFSPFGVGNPRPVFATHGITIRDIRAVGAEGKHLKLLLEKDGLTFSAIGFGLGNMIHDLQSAKTISIAFTPELSTWNGHTKIELKLKDIKT